MPPVTGHPPGRWARHRSLVPRSLVTSPIAAHAPGRWARAPSNALEHRITRTQPSPTQPAQPAQPQPAQPSPAQPNPAYNPRLEIPSQLLIALGPWLPTPEDPMWTHGGRNCDSTWLSKPGTIHNTTQEHTANATQNCAVSDIPFRGRRMAEGLQILLGGGLEMCWGFPCCFH